MADIHMAASLFTPTPDSETTSELMKTANSFQTTLTQTMVRIGVTVGHSTAQAASQSAASPSAAPTKT